jgi:hypothetical protein
VVDRIFPEFKEQEVIQEKAFYAKYSFKLKEQSEAGASGSSSTAETPASRRSKSTTSTMKSPHSVAPARNGGILSCYRPFTIEVYPQQTCVLLRSR